MPRGSGARPTASTSISSRSARHIDARPLATLGPVETGAIEVVLFDLGGVLVDFGGVGPMRELSGIESDDELWRRWLTCRWVRSFERGGCSAEDFAAGVVSDWNLPITPDEFLEGFGNWLCGPLQGSDELVSAVRALV